MNIDLTKFDRTRVIKRTINITADELPSLQVLKKEKVNISAFFRFCIKQLADEITEKNGNE